MPHSGMIYKMDGPKDLAPDNLLFWPDNPRLKISDFSEVKFTDKQLLNSSNQKKIFRLLREHEHSVDELIASMTHAGFMREKAPIVMRVDGTNKYMVLEGNRRLTAIKTLLAEKPKSLPAEVLSSLNSIPCWVFVHDTKTVPLSVAISRMVAEQHIKGQKPHTKIQQAHMLYNSYMGFLLEEWGNTEFEKDAAIIKQCAEFFDISVDELELELSVVCLYKQLTGTGYEVPHNLRERLTWVNKNPRHFTKYFGYDTDDLRLSDPGVERYHSIFVEDGCAVHSPALFKKFVNVMRYGKEAHIGLIQDDPGQLLAIEQEIMDKKDNQRFFLELQRVERKLSSLKISEYRESAAEDELIEKISRLVDMKLKRLTSNGNPTEPLEDSSESLPTTIQGAQLIGHGLLSAEIISVINSCRGDSCTVDRIPTKLLQRWEIVSRGAPRQAFCKLVEQTVEAMKQEGRLT